MGTKRRSFLPLETFLSFFSFLPFLPLETFLSFFSFHTGKTFLSFLSFLSFQACLALSVTVRLRVLCHLSRTRERLT